LTGQIVACILEAFIGAIALQRLPEQTVYIVTTQSPVTSTPTYPACG
jgi:hypothetical protein